MERDLIQLFTAEQCSACPLCYANSSHTHSFPEDNLQLWKTGRMPPVETAALCSELRPQMLFQLLFYTSTLSQKSPSSESKNQRIWRSHHPFWCVTSKRALKNRVIETQLMRDGVGEKKQAWPEEVFSAQSPGNRPAGKQMRTQLSVWAASTEGN